MKSKICWFGVVTILMFSCSDVSEDYSLAATELCECMKKSGYESGDEGSVKMNIGVCLLDAKVDLKNPKMVEELEDKCPEIKDDFDKFVKSM